MKQNFIDALADAQGRSEFVIVVVADIRGFSRFSTVNESPNIAMFIKRFYLQLIKKHFKAANFVKPTGDGLLMTFSYNEANLFEVSAGVLDACMTCLSEFPTICQDDAMINFEVPQAIGFGVARGTACCLYSGEETLDYSGHLLNLASRLNDLARPSGIVIDGGFLKEVIPASSRGLFEELQIPDSALSPLIGENWETINIAFTAKQLANAASRYVYPLPKPAESRTKIRVTLLVPRTGKGIKKGTAKLVTFKDFRYLSEGPEPQINLDIVKARAYVPAGNTKSVTFKIDYVPKKLPRT